MENKNNVNVNNKSLGILNILTIIFVIGKILGYVKFNWFICFLPSIIGIIIGLITIIFVMIIALITKK